MLTLNWNTIPKDNIVKIVAEKDGTQLWSQTNLQSTGNTTLSVGGTITSKYICTLTAKTPCGTTSKQLEIIYHKPAKVSLDHLEIIQATHVQLSSTQRVI